MAGSCELVGDAPEGAVAWLLALTVGRLGAHLSGYLPVVRRAPGPTLGAPRRGE